MEIVPIDQIPNQATEIPLDESIAKVYDTCVQMEDLCEKSDGIGLSAVQVGIPWKLFVIKSDGNNPLVPEGRYGYFVNCDYEEVTENDRIVSVEGCLSIRSPEGQLRSFQVERRKTIKLSGYMIKNNVYKEVDCVLDAFQQGVVFQHEIDHQRGRLISDLGQEIFLW